jgi:hypothetical protein
MSQDALCGAGFVDIDAEVLEEQTAHQNTSTPDSSQGPLLARSINKLKRSHISQNGARPTLQDPYLGVLETPQATTRRQEASSDPKETTASRGGETLSKGVVPRRARASVRSGKQSNFVSANAALTETTQVCF